MAADSGPQVLDDTELYILERVAWGATDVKIAGELRLSSRNVKLKLQGALDKVGVAHCRYAAALYYVRSILPTDMRGTPMDESKAAYTQPGEKFAEWTVWAKDIRIMMWLTVKGMANPRHQELLRLIADPRHVHKTVAQLVPLFSGPRITQSTVKGYLRDLTTAVASTGERGSRAKLVTVAALAPLDEA